MQDYTKKQFALSLCVYIGQLLCGSGLGWSSPFIPKLQDPLQTPLPEVITDVQVSWVSSTIYFGNVIGPFIAGYLSNKYGRKPTFFLGGVINAIATLLLATSVNIVMIYAGRVLTGLGGTMIMIINVVYLGEIASPNIRGIIITVAGLFQTIGVLLVYSIAPFVAYPVTMYILFILNICYLLGLFIIPESPMFYAIRGQEAEAIKSLKILGRTDPADVASILAAKQKTPPTIASGWKDIVGMRSNRQAMFVTMPLAILQQLSGMTTVLMFSTTIFDMAGSSIEPHIATIVIGVTQLVASGITPLFVERMGRKFLLLGSSAGCFLSLMALGAYFFFDDAGYDMKNMGWLPLVTLIIFCLTYSLGLGVIPYTFLGEMFSANARSFGSVIVISVSWASGFGINTAFGYMLPVIGGHYSFWIFALACAVAFFFTVFFVPETKGKTLLEIQEMFEQKKFFGFKTSLPNPIKSNKTFHLQA